MALKWHITDYFGPGTKKSSMSSVVLDNSGFGIQAPHNSRGHRTVWALINTTARTERAAKDLAERIAKAVEEWAAVPGNRPKIYEKLKERA